MDSDQELLPDTTLIDALDLSIDQLQHLSQLTRTYEENPVFLKDELELNNAHPSTLQLIRARSGKYRKDYLNWRKCKPKGAKGETDAVFEKRVPESLLNTEKMAEAAASVFPSFLSEVYLKTQEPSQSSPTLNGVSSDLNSPTITLQHSGLSRRLTTSDFILQDEVVHIPPSSITGPCESVNAEQDKNIDWTRFYFNPLTPVDSLSFQNLKQSTLTQLNQSVQIPKYCRNASLVKNWILHVGVGGFHRSHQAAYLDDLLHLDPPDCTTSPPLEPCFSSEKWGICGIGLTLEDEVMAKALRKQDLLYTVLTRGNTISKARVIGSIHEFIFLPEEFTYGIKKLASESTYVVSLTVTEKGYYINNKGSLDKTDLKMQKDLNLFPKSCLTVIGFISVGLYYRKRLGRQPFTVLSCDNLPGNGDIIRKQILEFTKFVDPELSKWIETTVSFPNTVVDRITVKTLPEHKEILCRDFGILDEWPVVTEPFGQWIIEKNFCNKFPDFTRVGVIITQNYHIYELMKLRLLNGGHSAIAYLSYLAGFRFVDDAVSNSSVASFLRCYMDEVADTIQGVDLEKNRYKEAIVERFGNSFIKDSLERICEDGSLKFYTTMKDAIWFLVKEKRHIDKMALAVACWIKYMSGVDESNSEINIKDCSESRLRPLAVEIMVQPLDYQNIAKYIRAVLGDELDIPVWVNQIALNLFCLKSFGIHNILRCGSSLQCLLEAHFTSNHSLQKLIKFLAIEQNTAYG